MKILAITCCRNREEGILLDVVGYFGDGSAGPSMSIAVRLVLIAGCDEERSYSPADISTANAVADKPDSSLLRDELGRLDVVSQLFSAPGDKLSLITGKKGTVVFIAPDDLETESGGRPGQTINVELKELTNRSELMRANAATVSDGRLLTSGGAYYLRMTAGGKELRVKKDRTMKVAFPRITERDMELYYGERDSAGNMNWAPTGQKLTARNGYSVDTEAKSIMIYDERDYHVMGYVGSDSSYSKDTAMLGVVKSRALAERKLRRRYNDSVASVRSKYDDSVRKERYKVSNKLNTTLYDIAGIKKMGWLNVDKLTGERTANSTYSIDPKDSITYAKVYLVYKDMNRMTSATYYALDKGGYTRSLGTVSVGYKVRLIAVACKNGQLHSYSIDITTAADQHNTLVWHPTDKTELERLFDLGDLAE